MSVIYEENNFKLIRHDRQLQTFKDQDEIVQYQLKEILFDNFKRKLKKKNNPDALEDVTELKAQIESFLQTCRTKKCFTLIDDEDEKYRLKNENIELLNSFYAVSSDFGSFHGENNFPQGTTTKFNLQTFLIPSNCKFFNKKIEDIETFLPGNATNKFDYIVIDPPWKNRYIKRVKKSSANKQGYFTMSDEEILKIPLENYIKKSSIVVVWCTNSESHINSLKSKILAKWKLKLLSTWQWVKVDKNGELFCAIDGNKKPFEQIFIATHEANESFDERLRQDLFIFSQPSSIHSHKPLLIGEKFELIITQFRLICGLFTDLFCQHLPQPLNCLEIFARNLYENFTSVGLEVLKLQNILLYEKFPR